MILFYFKNKDLQNFFVAVFFGSPALVSHLAYEGYTERRMTQREVRTQDGRRHLSCIVLGALEPEKTAAKVRDLFP